MQENREESPAKMRDKGRIRASKRYGLQQTKQHVQTQHQKDITSLYGWQTLGRKSLAQ